MAENKTKPTSASVEKFLNSIQDEDKRSDCYAILELMRKASKKEPEMWGTSMIGFGNYHYVYESGREGDTFQIGFSPRKQNITLYMTCDISQFDVLLKKLGKHKTGKGCLYINKLSEIDQAVLKQIITKALSTQKG